ncbi:MAG: hypothetical protein JWO06_3560 [Bacteroidota bacterium]|nr:hypothetical protein [Bacteroidota bacterium]
MKIRLAFLSAVIFFSSTLFGQYRSIDNIGVDAISVIELGANGDSWVGTNGDGVYFYKDSTKSWFHYTTINTPSLKSDTITGIATGYIGGVQHAFIATTKGMSYDRAGIWDTLGPIPDQHIAGVILRPDSIWVITRTGISNFDSSKVHRQNFSLPILPAIAAQTGTPQCALFCVATANNGCYHTSDGINFSYVDTSAPHGHLVDNRVNVVVIDNQCNRKIIGTKGGLSLCPNGPPCQNFTTANGLPQNDITAVAEGCNGEIWIGTRDSGVVIYNNSTFSRITSANGLSSDKVTSLSVTGAGCSVWIGMADGNIAALDSNKNVVGILSGIEKVKAASFGVHVFPQPANSQVNFLFETELNQAELYITDISGRQVQAVSINNRSNALVDVTNLSSGMYFYQLQSSGQMLKAGKVQVVR